MFVIYIKTGVDGKFRMISYIEDNADGKKYKRHQYTVSPENEIDGRTLTMWKDVAENPKLALTYLRTDFGEGRDNSVTYKVLKRILKGEVALKIIEK